MALNDRSYFYAGPSKEADVAAWKQSMLAEAADCMSVPYVSTLLDLVKAFDSVPFDHLSLCAARVGYNLYLLRLSIAAYQLARVVQDEGCCSDLVWASRGLAAGSVLATIELRVLLIEAGDRLVSMSIYCRFTLYVDDATVETFCPASFIAEEHSRVVRAFVQDLGGIRLQFSETKNVVNASTPALARTSQ